MSTALRILVVVVIAWYVGQAITQKYQDFTADIHARIEGIRERTFRK